MIHPTGTITHEQARALLRRLRDLNLGPAGIEVSDGGRIVVSGCLSLDHPVENGVRYSLLGESGQQVLRIYWRSGRLLLQLSSPVTERMNDQVPAGELDVSLSCDGLGRLAAPALGARLHLEDNNAREIEHFLRRIVRAVYSKAA